MRFPATTAAAAAVFLPNWLKMQILELGMVVTPIIPTTWKIQV
jgi:hypothetical protein